MPDKMTRGMNCEIVERAIWHFDLDCTGATKAGAKRGTCPTMKSPGAQRRPKSVHERALLGTNLFAANRHEKSGATRPIQLTAISIRLTPPVKAASSDLRSFAATVILLICAQTYIRSSSQCGNIGGYFYDSTRRCIYDYIGEFTSFPR